MNRITSVTSGTGIIASIFDPGDVYVDQFTGNFAVSNPSSGGKVSLFSSSMVLDTEFWTNQGTGYGIRPSGISFQPDGKVVTTSRATTLNGVPCFGVARLNADGTPDLAFNANITGMTTSLDNNSTKNTIQSDGKILVYGQVTAYNGNSVGRLVRLNSDGTTDTTFMTNIGTGANSSISSCKVQSTGHIVLVGDFTSFNGTSINRIIRLNSDGTIDGTFSANIGTGLGAGVYSSPTTMTILPDDSIIVVGYFTSFNGNARNYLIRLNSDGTENSAFYTAVSPAVPRSQVDYDSSGNIYLTGNSNPGIVVNNAGALQYSISTLGAPSTSAFGIIYRGSPDLAYWGVGGVIYQTLTTIPLITWTCPAGVTEVIVQPIDSDGIAGAVSKPVSVSPNTTYSIVINSSSYSLNNANTLGSIYTWTGSSNILISWVE